MRPISWDMLTCGSGWCSSSKAATSISWSAITGLKTPVIATERIPASPIRSTTRRSSSRSNRAIVRPSNSNPPWQSTAVPCVAASSDSGQSNIGGNAAVAGRPSRTTAVGANRSASTIAFTT